MKRAASGIVPVISVDRRSSKPLHRQLYDEYRAAIAEGRLRPGQRIPSSRVLACELGVSRFPVVNAYAQLLAEGYLESRVGAGTVVSSSLPSQLTSTRASRAEVMASGSGRRLVARPTALLPQSRSAWMGGMGAFQVGQVAADQFPFQIWSHLVSRACRNLEPKALHYGDPRGSSVLRQTLVTYLRTARSLHCEADQILIVSGSQQALEISARALVERGNRAWIEEPGYRLAGDVLSLAGCQLVPVPVDSEGMDVAAGVKQCPRARIAFVTPSHQFPLGVTMSASRRLRLLEWAQSCGSWILEDDYDSEYRYESTPVASLQGLDRYARVIYIGTFSKVLFPSLRLGYVVVPADLVDRFLRIRRAMDLTPPGFHQEVIAQFIEEGHFARHIRRMRALYSERRSALVASLRKELGPAVEVLGSEAGMHLVMTLPAGTPDREIAEQAASRKLWVWPLSQSYLGKTSRRGLILGFGGTPTAEIPGAVRALRDVLKARLTPRPPTD